MTKSEPRGFELRTSFGSRYSGFGSSIVMAASEIWYGAEEFPAAAGQGLEESSRQRVPGDAQISLHRLRSFPIYQSRNKSPGMFLRCRRDNIFRRSSARFFARYLHQCPPAAFDKRFPQ